MDKQTNYFVLITLNDLSYMQSNKFKLLSLCIVHKLGVQLKLLCENL